MDNRTNCLERAGHILILCLWVEKRLADLILLKENPKYIQLINASDKFPSDYTELRLKEWEKSFWDIQKKFIELFSPSQDWLKRIEWINATRDAIAHGQVSLYRDYLLYRPAEDRKGKDRLTLSSVFESEPKRDAHHTTVFLVRFSDDSIYSKMVDAITEMDEKYLKHEATQLGLNYEKIR